MIVCHSLLVFGTYFISFHYAFLPKTIIRRFHHHKASFALSVADAISILDASQTETVNKIATSVPDLVSKPLWTTTIDGYAVTLDARDAPGPSNIAWLSNLCIDSKLSSLTIFNGPLTNVPHLISRCAVVTGNDNNNNDHEETLFFMLDFRPRAYGAYELKQPDGTYPGPETLGRAAFEHSAARRDYQTKFLTESIVTDLIEATLSSLEGCVISDPANFLHDTEKLLRGPNALSCLVPATEANVEVIKIAREQAAELWLRWALDPSHAHRPGAPINSQYVYDTKYRQNSYLSLLNLYTEIFGRNGGTSLAAADSGPLDEGYVGGGS
jgi:hypothetical protein